MLIFAYGNDGAAARSYSLESSDGGIHVMSGLEVGYLARIPFDDQIAGVTATDTQDTFEHMGTQLLIIIASVRMPAEEEQRSGGLGGSGGLLPEGTPESTEELKGLDGL